jgi:hypothetical protein
MSRRWFDVTSAMRQASTAVKHMQHVLFGPEVLYRYHSTAASNSLSAYHTTGDSACEQC